MSDCDVCGARTDTRLCNRCARTLEKALAETPALLAELDVTISRQDRGTGAPLYAAARRYVQEPGRDYDEGTITLPSTPWPFSWDAADLRWRIDNTLSTWLRHLLEARGAHPGVLGLDGFERAAGRGLNSATPDRVPSHTAHAHVANSVIGYRYTGSSRKPIGRCPVCGRTAPMRPPMPDAATLSRIMLRLLDSIRMDEAAAAIYDEITSCEWDARRAIDRQGPDVFLGRCDALVLGITPSVELIRPEPCGADLMGHTGEREVKCARCGAEYDVVQLKKQLLAMLPDEIATTTDIANGLTDLLEPVTPSMIRQMAFRGQIQSRGIDPADRKSSLYRVGDVLDVLEQRRRRPLSEGRGRVAI